MRLQVNHLTGRWIAVGMLCVAGLAGCSSSELETGYVPRKLGGNAMARRAYYAAPFTPEAQAAQAAQGTNDPAMRDVRGPGGGFR